MSKQPLTLRLNCVYKSGDGPTSGPLTWYFSLLGGVTSQRDGVARRLVKLVNETYHDEAKSDQLMRGRRELPEIARFNRQGFSIRPQPILNARQAGQKALDKAEVLLRCFEEIEQLISTQNCRVDLLRGLDHFTRLKVSNFHSTWNCQLLAGTDSRALGQAHIKIVREIWAQYLDWFLLNSPERSGLTQPDLMAELILGYPALDYLIARKLFEHHLVKRVDHVFQLPAYSRFYSTDEIRESLARLAEAGIVGDMAYDPASEDEEDKLNSALTEGPNAKYIYPHKLPVL
jgi:hypothetical protein